MLLNMQGSRKAPYILPGCFREVARNRFHRFQKQQRTLDEMVNDLCPDRKNGVVILGNFNGRNAIKGETMRSPVKKLRRHLAKCRALIVIDEYKTSCTCSLCEGGIIHPKEIRMISNRKLERMLAHAQRTGEVNVKEFRDLHKKKMVECAGISECKSCSRRLPRDLNAVHNMSRCFWNITTHGERPKYLSRISSVSHTPRLTA